MFGTKNCTSPKEHYTHSKTWWQHHALGLHIFSQNWGFYQGGGNHEYENLNK